MLYSFLPERIRSFLQGAFVQNVMLLQAGSFAANVFRALINVVLARILQPELFGIYAIAFSMAEFAVTILGFGAQEAVTTVVSAAYAREDRQETKEALAFLVKITILVGFLLVIASLFLPFIAQRLYGDSMIGVYAATVIFASLISMTFFSVTNLGLQVTGHIGSLAVVTFLDQVLRFGAGLLLVLGGFGVFGAMAGHVIGALVMVIISVVLWYRLQRRYHIFPHFRELIDYVKKVSIGKYLRFSFWITADKNLANLFSSLPILLTGLFLSATEVTYLRLSLSYLNLALSLLVPISILLNVEFPKLKALGHSIRSKFVTVSFAALGISTVLTIGAEAVAPLAIRILYGENFLPSVLYIRGLALYAALFGIGVGLGSMWRALRQVKTSILINISTLVIGIPAGILLIRWYGLWGSVAMVTLWYVASQFVSFFYLNRKLRHIEFQSESR